MRCFTWNQPRTALAAGIAEQNRFHVKPATGQSVHLSAGSERTTGSPMSAVPRMQVEAPVIMFSARLRASAVVQELHVKPVMPWHHQL